MGQGVRILGTCLVKARIVNTHYPFVVLFGHQDRICEPVWMQNLPDEACLEELSYLFFYSPASFVVKPSQALLDRLGVGTDS